MHIVLYLKKTHTQTTAEKEREVRQDMRMRMSGRRKKKGGERGK